MSDESNAFEKMIKKIHDLLEGQDAIVIWNDKLPDPDNPKQMRQIDVSIRKGSLLNIVECRIHKHKQNVQWIEELIGRRLSLNADGVIAVSASGFTAGAIRKANQYGIILRDLLTLSQAEIESWSKAISITMFFYAFDNLEISFFLDKADIHEAEHLYLSNEIVNSKEFQAILNAVFSHIDSQNLIIKDNRHKNVIFSMTLSIDDFQFHGMNVINIIVKGKVTLGELKLNIPTAYAYGIPSSKSINRNIYIQKYNLGQTEAINHNGKVTLYLDLCKLNVLPLRQFRFFETTSEEENYFEEIEISNSDKLRMNLQNCKLLFYPSNI